MTDNDSKVDIKLYKRLVAFFKPYKAELIFSILITIIGTLTILAPPLVFQYAIDEYIVKDTLSPEARFSGVLMMLAVYFVVLIIDFAFKFYKGYITAKLGQRAIRDLRQTVFSHLQQLSLKWYDKNPIGRIMTRVTNDIEALNDMFTQGVITIAGDFFMILGIIIVLLVLNLKMALWTFAVLPLLFVISFIFRINVRKNLLVVRSLVAKLNAFTQENLSGIHIIKLFNRQKENFAQFKQINKDHTESWIKNVILYSFYFPAVEIISSIAIALIIWNASDQLIDGETSFGVVFTFIIYAQMFFRPISDLSEKYNIIQSAMAASERIFDVLDTKADIVNKENPQIPAHFSGTIEFRNVWFSYQSNPQSDADYVLKDVSFTVQPGEHVAIVGHTGAGKTTIINLMNRFYDIQKGEILIDGINIKDWSIEGLRSHIGMVLQDIYLFSGSVYENIGLNSEQISKDEILAACKTVNADQFIKRLPDGYDTKIKERGGILSTGQKQLLSFARALVFNPDILVLDEATSSIDTETELLIQNAMTELMKDRSSIIIAHRLSTIKDADQIIVMHHGEIREKGSHQELLKQKGLYYKLYQIQYRDQEVA
ncbi:MAG: ABC transporter ATP-binding protein [Calditrichaeota bacterium]|nr:ABC transporter ATP-binding protein [Calditrichota bacterium]